jgi:protein-tyrosine phosphatase
VVAAVVGAALLWQVEGVKQLFGPRNWGEVEPGFYRSGQISRFVLKKALQQHDVKLVVFMSGDKANRPDVQAEAQICRDLGIERINCGLAGDGTGDIRSYANAIEAISKARREGKAVLVHCHTGSQRTGGAVAYYRMLVEGRPAAEAHAELIRYGHDPRDNPDLLPYLNAHMRELADILVERRVIDRAPAPLPVLPQ